MRTACWASRRTGTPPCTPACTPACTPPFAPAFAVAVAFLLALAACTAGAAPGPAAVVASAGPVASPAAPADAVRAAPAGPGRTRIVFPHEAGGPVSLVVARDAVVPPRAPPQDVRLVGRVGRTVALVVDTYRSRLNDGSGQCGSGEERFLRVVRLAPAPARETLRLKLASCWDGIELQEEFGEGGLRWSAEAGELRIEWLFGPTRHDEAESRTLRIAPDGRASPT